MLIYAKAQRHKRTGGTEKLARKAATIFAPPPKPSPSTRRAYSAASRLSQSTTHSTRRPEKLRNGDNLGTITSLSNFSLTVPSFSVTMWNLNSPLFLSSSVGATATLTTASPDPTALHEGNSFQSTLLSPNRCWLLQDVSNSGRRERQGTRPLGSNCRCVSLSPPLLVISREFMRNCFVYHLPRTPSFARAEEMPDSEC